MNAPATYAPCPFCGETTDPDIEASAGETEFWLHCINCLAQGPVATVGCRDEDDLFDLEQEAIDLWNDRPRGPVTIEEIHDLAPALQKSLEELEKIDPEVRARAESYDATVQKILKEKP